MLLTTALLIAQVSAPPCGYWLGADITPDNNFLGCTLPDFYGRPAVHVQQNPFTPSGYQATPIQSD